MKRIKEYLLGLYGVYMREFRLIVRDQGIIIFFAFLPLAYPIIYSLIYNPEIVKEVPVVVVDSDGSALSRRFVRELGAADEVYVQGYAADMAEARRAMDGHDCYAILQIPEGFARKVGRGESAPAVLYTDMSLLLRYRGFLVASTEVMQHIGGEIRTADIDREIPLAETIVTGDLLPIGNVQLGNPQSGFDSFIMPGVLILILQQCILLALGMAGGARHEKASLIGYNPHNNSKYITATMIGQAACYFTIICLPGLYMIHYVPMIFSFPMQGNILQEVVFLTPMLIACFGMGFFLQALITEREAIFPVWVVTTVMFLFLSGLIWPRYAMPPVWRALSDIFPCSWGVEGFIKMNSNGATLAQVRHEYIMLWLNAAGWWAAGYCMQRWVLRPQIARLQKKKATQSCSPSPAE